LNDRAKEFSNNAQYLIAALGDTLSRVLIYMALNTDNQTGEFIHSNQKIARNIKSHKDSVSKAIQKLKKLGFIAIWYDHNADFERRTITWSKNFTWGDIRDTYKANRSMVDESVYEVSEDLSTTLDEKTQTLRPNDLGINNTSLNTLPNTSFNSEKEKYKKNNLEKVKNE
jgi:biotin operon repressor